MGRVNDERWRHLHDNTVFIAQREIVVDTSTISKKWARRALMIDIIILCEQNGKTIFFIPMMAMRDRGQHAVARGDRAAATGQIAAVLTSTDDDRFSSTYFSPCLLFEQPVVCLCGINSVIFIYTYHDVSPNISSTNDRTGNSSFH